MSDTPVIRTEIKVIIMPKNLIPKNLIPINADAIKLVAVDNYKEIFVTSQTGVFANLLQRPKYAKSRQLLVERTQVFAESLKEKITPFNEQTVGIVLDVVFNSTGLNDFKVLKEEPNSVNEFGNLLLGKVESQDALCLRHLTNLSDLKREELWMYVRELFGYPMHKAIARANLNLYIVQEGFEETTEDYTTSNSHTFEDGYADYLLYIITSEHVQFVHQPQNGMSSNLALSLSYDEFYLLIMELYRSQDLNWGAS